MTTNRKLHLKRSRTESNFIDLIQSQSICQILAIFWVESERTASKFRKRNFCVAFNLLHKAGAWNEEVSCRSRATTVGSVSKRVMHDSLRKQPTFGDATTSFPAKWRLRKERRNSILMTRHYRDLGSDSDWLNQISHPARPIRSTTQIWVVTLHQYGISALVSQTFFGRETSGSIAKCRLLRLDERARTKLLSWQSKLIALPFSLTSPSSLFKLPTIVIQKFCYYGNVTSHLSSLLAWNWK